MPKHAGRIEGEADLHFPGLHGGRPRRLDREFGHEFVRVDSPPPSVGVANAQLNHAIVREFRNGFSRALGLSALLVRLLS